MRVTVMAVSVDERRLRLADDDETPIRRAQDLDRRSVETTEGLARDHVLGSSFHRTAPGDVDDAVEVAEDRIDVVRDEQHGDVLLLADALDERRDGALVRQVETVERFVEQE